jgi:PAS domain S-box-containing protein
MPVLEKERSIIVPVSATIAVLVILGIGVFFGWQYIENLFLTALLSTEVLQEFTRLLVYGVLVAGTLGSFLIAIIVFLLLSSNQRARYLAVHFSHAERMSSRWLATLYDGGPTPYLLVDKNGQVHNPNKATVRLFGKEATSIEGEPFTSFFPDIYKSEVEDALMRFYRGIAVVDRELRIIGKDGRRRWILLSIFAISGMGAQDESGLAAFVDVTERKELERQKSEFLSLTSHQLHTPLIGIRWYTEMLLHGDAGVLTGKQREYLDTIHRENEQMINLVGLLLNVSRLEMGHLPVKITELNISEVCDSVAEELMFTVEAKRLQFRKEYQSTVSTIKSDQRLVRVVIQNLLSNAVKYTPEDGIVTVSLKGGGEKVQVRVSDTGIGIPKEDQVKLFDRSFRASNVIDAAGQSSGNGLGLYLIKSIVFLLGGSISFTSEQNKGSTFVVELPTSWSQQASEAQMLLLRGEVR